MTHPENMPSKSTTVKGINFKITGLTVDNDPEAVDTDGRVWVAIHPENWRPHDEATLDYTDGDTAVLAPRAKTVAVGDGTNPNPLNPREIEVGKEMAQDFVSNLPLAMKSSKHPVTAHLSEPGTLAPNEFDEGNSPVVWLSAPVIIGQKASAARQELKDFAVCFMYALKNNRDKFEEARAAEAPTIVGEHTARAKKMSAKPDPVAFEIFETIASIIDDNAKGFLPDDVKYKLVGALANFTCEMNKKQTGTIEIE